MSGAVLSLVIERPSVGASVCRRFEARYRGLLGSGRQHIYDALMRLVRDGLLERVPRELFDELADEDARGAITDGYRATAAGARAYRGWLTEPIEPSKLSRQETLIRLASTQPNDRATALALIDRYEQVILRLMQGTPLEVGNVMDELVADERTDFAQAELRWIARTRDKLGDG
ncbi:DNA-binding PadR family transcriptional regulator [Conexibacter arvalis]|uniref:DNA-binding PadR family transcriptional regulator n=1 Tax=Conexibacter arvalis TaxID=912552 RepID=A0A840IH36_9ACTN|nr:DNA-binding PadR family transcriptional regulator [Conexibacter arvalis]